MVLIMLLRGRVRQFARKEHRLCQGEGLGENGLPPPKCMA